MVILLLTLLLLASCTGQSADKVNPFIGTDYNGHTFPGATYPRGLVQPGPATGNLTWDYCAGYRYTDSLFLGFSQTRLSGTGVGDLGDILLMPFSDSVRTDYASLADKAGETARPGYYAVYLPDNRVRAEMTAAEHTAFYRFDYDGETRRLYLDFGNITGSNREVLEAEITHAGPDGLEGTARTRGWVRRQYSFAIRFNAPVTAEASRTPEGRKAPVYVLEFPDSRDPLLVKVALSTVSTEGAWKNMDAEIPHWDFGKTLAAAGKAWDEILNLVRIEGTPEQETIFYTGLYHMYIQPNNIADVDGQYRGADGEVHRSGSGRHYSTLSQWDTFRAANPFYNLMSPDFGGDLAATMVRSADENGYLPIWGLWGKDNHCMIGNHSVPVVVDAALRGLPGVDAEKVYEAVRRSLTVNHKKSDWDVYDAYGYLPYDIIRAESVSRTLEQGYDDWCAALLAERLGKTEDAAFFKARSKFYKNIIDPAYGLARGRNAKGEWRTPFEPFRYVIARGDEGGDYTEGNGWQYTWHVMQDVPGLIELLGGNEAFVRKLDSLYFFTPDESVTGNDVEDVSGLIGQYAHGNEPSHHVAYLFALAGCPERTQELIRQICTTLYSDRPDGLCGNEDCGQMSAWYVFSVLGFYPVDPVSGEFIFGAPQVSRAVLHLPNGKTLTLLAEGLGEDAKYVRSISLNGKKLGDRITVDELLGGGKLVYEMTPIRPH